MDQTEEPSLKNQHQHPEEEEHHENGASKMFRKVKAKAKKFKNSLTNKPGQTHEHDHDVVEEDDDDDELEQKKPESLSHPRETNVPTPEEIIPPGTKVFPVVSSDYTKPVESELPVQDTSSGHDDAPAHSVRTYKEESKDEPTTHNPLSGHSDREENREGHHVPLFSGTEDVKSKFAPTGGEDEYLGGQRKVNVEGRGEAGVSEIAESLDRMKVEDDTSDQRSGVGFERDLSTRSKEFRDFDQDFAAVAGKDSSAENSELGKDFPTKSHDYDMKTEFDKNSPSKSREFKELDGDFESILGKDSPARLEGESEAELGKDLSSRSHDFDMKTESGIDENSPLRSHEFDLKTESGIDKNSQASFGSASGVELGKDLPTESYDFDQKIGSGKNEYTPTETDGGGLGAPLGGNFPVKSHISPTESSGESDFLAKGRPGYGVESEERNFPANDVEVETELGSDLPTKTHEQFSPELSRPKEKDEFLETETDGGLGAPLGGNFPVKKQDSPTESSGESDFLAKGRPGYGVESEDRNFPARSDDVEVETELGKDLPTETHEQFSPELSRPKERDEFLETRDSFEETKDETKPSAYTDEFATATSALTNQAIAAKNAVTSKLGYTGESPVGDETHVAGSVEEELTSVNEKNRETESTKLPLSGGGSEVEETEVTEQGGDKGVSGKDYLSEKLTPKEEDKALSEVLAEKLKIGGVVEEKEATTKKEVEVEKIPKESSEHGEVADEEVKEGGGMVGMIKGWFGGGATEEVKPKSPNSGEESPQPRGWFGGATTEEVKPKSPHSVEESPQSLGTTVGTKGFPDSSLGDTTGRGDGAVPVQKGL